jgi:hypothetical protein
MVLSCGVLPRLIGGLGLALGQGLVYETKKGQNSHGKLECKGKGKGYDGNGKGKEGDGQGRCQDQGKGKGNG